MKIKIFQSLVALLIIVVEGRKKVREHFLSEIKVFLSFGCPVRNSNIERNLTINFQVPQKMEGFWEGSFL